MKYQLGFSPCPNDTFIFDALVNGKIDTEGLELDLKLADVQELNQWALEGQLHFSKISYGVVPQIQQHYQLLTAGGALGMGVGPLLITHAENENRAPQTGDSVALPGINTTAHLLFTLAYPDTFTKSFLLFSDIEKALLDKKVDYGVIIHENRFTYADKGLKLIRDLGTHWETLTGLPIPLGAIAARRDIAPAVVAQLNRLIRKSLDYAFTHSLQTLPSFVTENAQEMSEEVMRDHIRLYVNEYSLDLGENGKKAVERLLGLYQQIHPGTREASLPLFSAG